MYVILVLNMTIDDSPPNKKDFAYDELDRKVDIDSVFDTMFDMRLLPKEALKNENDPFKIEFEDLALKINKAVAKIIFYRARNTEAWSNSATAGSPSHNSETVEEVLDRIELLEVADTITIDLMSSIGTGIYENQHVLIEVEKSKNINISNYKFPDPDF